MRTIKIIITVLFTCVIGITAAAQTHSNTQSSNKKEPSTVNSLKTVTFLVYGNCGMCKSRIEKAAKNEGASESNWDSKTKILTVKFDPAKTNRDSIEKNIASAGHDTEKYRASDEVYSGLPGCCHYERSN